MKLLRCLVVLIGLRAHGYYINIQYMCINEAQRRFDQEDYLSINLFTTLSLCPIINQLTEGIYPFN